MGMLADTAIIDYRLLFSRPRENKVPFSISVCSKQMELWRFRFLLQQPNRNCRFSFAEFGNMET
jgi:hypothetical protein